MISMVQSYKSRCSSFLMHNLVTIHLFNRFPFVENEIEKYWRDHIDLANNKMLNQKGNHQFIVETLVANKELKVEEIVREILTKEFLDIKASKNFTYNDPSDCLIEVCESLFKENEDIVTKLPKKLAIKRRVKIIRHNVFGQVIGEKGEVIFRKCLTEN